MAAMNDLGPLPTAKSLIQSLLLAADDRAYPARQLVAACALFDLTENNVRVALVRLQSEGILEAEGRGFYRLGPAAMDLAQEVSAWRQVEDRIQHWDGQYIGVHCGGLARSDKTAQSRRQQAFKLHGFAELEKGLFIRPDNLTGGVDDLRQRLHQLGLESGAIVFRADQFGPAHQTRLRTLWHNLDLNQRYQTVQQQLEAWLTTASKLSPAQAAREAFLLGRPAIRQVLYDPLLPDGMVDIQARQHCFETIRRFDSAGRALWWQFFQFSDTPPASSI